jgi:hypothetical protein
MSSVTNELDQWQTVLQELEAQLHDPYKLTSLLLPAIAEALQEQAQVRRGAIAHILTPGTSTSIEERIATERDAIVESLYPVIGAAVSQYLAETIRHISDRLAYSLEGMGAHPTYGGSPQVSAAELLGEENTTFAPHTAFLMHRVSGLVIAKSQHPNESALDPEIVAGILATVRSLSHAMATQQPQPQQPQEITLNALNYGSFRVLLAMTKANGLAVVVKGTPSQGFIRQLKQTLGTIVQQYRPFVESFAGDTTTVPRKVPKLLHQLLKEGHNPESSGVGFLPMVASLGIVALLAGAGFWGYQQLQRIPQTLEEATHKALAADGDLAIYNLGVEADRQTLVLIGKVPYVALQNQAQQVAQRVVAQTKLPRFKSTIRSRLTVVPWPKPWPKPRRCSTSSTQSRFKPNCKMGNCKMGNCKMGNCKMGWWW